MVAALCVGDVAVIALPLAAFAAAAVGAVSWLRRVAIGSAVVLLGAYAGLVAHWLVYDHGALTEYGSGNGIVVRGLVAVTLAAAGIALANRPRTRVRR